jgi:hypothetical protein
MGSYPWGPHGPQSGPNQVTPNPTAPYVPPPPAPAWTPTLQGGSGGGPVVNTGYVPGPSGPRTKHYWLAVVLTFFFGPLGLFYSAKKGALLMIFVLFAAPVGLAAMGQYPMVSPAHPFRALLFDSIMNPMYRLVATVCVIWSLVGVYRFNAQQKTNAQEQ